MRLIRLVKFLAVVVATSAVFTNNVAAGRALIALPAPVSPTQAVTQSSTIVIGKVTSIEKDPVEVDEYKGVPKDQPKAQFKIAKVKISEALMGAKGLTEIKIGFSVNAVPGGGGIDGGEAPAIDLPIKGRPIRPRITPVALTEGQEGTFMVTRHWTGDFYILAGGFNAAPLDKKAADYDKKLAEVKKIITVMKDPVALLKSKEKDERYTALSVLTMKYRNWTKGTEFTEEAIPAEEAKLILDTIIELPWTVKPGDANPDYEKTLSNHFAIWLGTEQARLKFVYPQPKPGDNADTQNKMYEDAVIKFIKENREKFTLKRYVDKK